MTEREAFALRRAMEHPWPKHVVDTTRSFVYGVPLNLLTTFTYPVHDAPGRPKAPCGDA